MLSQPSVVAELVAKARQELHVTLNWKEKFDELLTKSSWRKKQKL